MSASTRIAAFVAVLILAFGGAALAGTEELGRDSQ